MSYGWWGILAEKTRSEAFDKTVQVVSLVFSLWVVDLGIIR
jgi:hypothetical protein